MQYLIMCRSLTHAQRSVSLLERKGITAVIIKAPQGLEQRGCGYAVSLYKQLGKAVAVLSSTGLIQGRIYKRLENGSYVEVQQNDLS